MSPIATMFMSTTAPSTATSSASGASSEPSTPNSIRSRPSMASDTDSTSGEEDDLALSWSGRWSLAHRILAVNILTLLLVALSTLYLDVFRNRLSKERVRQTRIETTTAALALSHVPEQRWQALLAAAGQASKNRLRLYAADGSLLIDSWTGSTPTYTLRDPS